MSEEVQHKTRHDDPSSTGGLGTPLETPLVTLPPIETENGAYPVSKRTGEPARKPLVLLAFAFFLAAAIVAHAAYWWFWWKAINITNFSSSAALISWIDPRPGSWQSIVAVVCLAIVALVMTALPGAAAYGVWQGLPHRRALAIAAVVSGLGAILFFPWAFAALACSVVGTVLVFLPALRGYFAAWEEIHNPAPVEIVPTTNVAYGPAPRFQ